MRVIGVDVSPHVEVYAVAVDDIDADPALYEALNVLNRGLSHTRAFWEDRKVVLAASMLGAALGLDEQTCTCQEIAAVVHREGPRLPRPSAARSRAPTRSKGDEEGGLMSYADALRHHVERSLRCDLGSGPLEPDGDGDYPLDLNGCVVWVAPMLGEEPALVRVWSPAAYGVKSSKALLTELNELNVVWRRWRHEPDRVVRVVRSPSLAGRHLSPLWVPRRRPPARRTGEAADLTGSAHACPRRWVIHAPAVSPGRHQ